MIRREKSEFMQVMEELTRQGIKGEELDKELAIRFFQESRGRNKMMENGISKLVDTIVDLAVDKEHSEKLAENFFEELDDKFKLPTVAYAIFIITAQIYLHKKNLQKITFFY